MLKEEHHVTGKTGLVGFIRDLGTCIEHSFLRFHWTLMVVIISFSVNMLFFNFRILAPTMYIFFASALPVIAFGAQLSKDTGKFFL